VQIKKIEKEKIENKDETEIKIQASVVVVGEEVATAVVIDEEAITVDVVGVEAAMTVVIGDRRDGGRQSYHGHGALS
jgi:hypothetical protein